MWSALRDFLFVLGGMVLGFLLTVAYGAYLARREQVREAQRHRDPTLH